MNDNPSTPSITSSKAAGGSVPYYIRALGMGIPSVLFGLLLSGWIAFIPGAMAGHADFRQLYAAAHIVRGGMAHHLYEYEVQKAFQDRLVSPEAIALPFIRPAYQAVLFVPFTFVPYRAAYWLMLTLNIGLLIVTFRLLSSYLTNLRTVWKWLPVAIFASFFPTGAALIQGQDSILLLTLLAAAFVTLAKGDEFTAGVLTGLGLFKFQLIIPIALLFILWRRWRFSAGFAIVAAALTCFSVWLTGTAQTNLYVRSLFSMGTGLPLVSKLSRYPLPVQMMANLHGLVFGIVRGRIADKWQIAATLVLSCVFLLWTAFTASRTATAMGLLLRAITCGVLVGYYAFVHDLSVLLVPVVITLNHFLAGEELKPGVGTLQVWSALLVFVGPMIQVFFPNYVYLVAFAIIFLLCSTPSTIGGDSARPKKIPIQP